MGLDQSWFTVVDGKVKELETFATHRKVGALEGFMANEYKLQGETGVFNCIDLTVTKEMLLKLANLVFSDDLDTDVSGFFWGDFHKNDIVEIMTAAAKAKVLLDDGKKVYYSSWW